MKTNKIQEEDLDFFAAHFPFTLLEEVTGKSFLITGGTGLIGSLLVRCLLRLNDRYDAKVMVTATARNVERVRNIEGYEQVSWIYQNMTEPLPKTERFDFIIHCASPTSSRFFVEHPVETMRTILNGTDTVLRHAQETKVQSMVYLSSLETYGTVTKEHEIFEDDCSGTIDPIDVRSSYPLGKRTAECLCHSYAKEYGMPVKIARLTQTFGAGVEYDDNRVFAQFARKIVEEKNIELHTTGETCRMYCYTIDALLAIFYLLIKGENGEAYNVANPETYISIRDMAEMLAESFGHGKSKVIINPQENMGYAPTTKLRLSTAKLQTLGWKPYYMLEEMFGRMIKHYQHNLIMI